jgi:hypothetical protein
VQTKCFLLALDFDTDDFVCDLFRLMLEVIRCFVFLMTML